MRSMCYLSPALYPIYTHTRQTHTSTVLLRDFINETVSEELLDININIYSFCISRDTAAKESFEM